MPNLKDIELGVTDWPATLQVNFVRSFCAGIVWTIIAFGNPPQGSSPFVMLLFPVVYFIALFPIGLLAIGIAKLGIPFVGLVSLVISFFVVVGDPLTFIVHKFSERVVPMEKYPFVTFSLFIQVIKQPINA